jgi:hypothetical protein
MVAEIILSINRRKGLIDFTCGNKKAFVPLLEISRLYAVALSCREKDISLRTLTSVFRLLLVNTRAFRG